MSGGYYNSDEESDSSSVTTISYRENPVKVFKKKSGPRKTGARSKRADNVASPVSSTKTAPQQHDAWSTLSRPTVRSAASNPPAAALGPALSPSSSCSTTQSLCGSRQNLHFKPDPPQLSQCSLDSSGYSSSEGPYRKPQHTSSSRTIRIGGGYTDWIRNAFSILRDSVSVKVAAVQSRIRQQAHAASISYSAQMKKVCGPLLLFLFIFLGIWVLFSCWTLLLSRVSTMRTPPQMVVPPSPRSQPSTMQPASLLSVMSFHDPAVVCADVQAKMEQTLKEIQLKEGLLLSKFKAQVQSDIKTIAQKLESLSELHTRIEEYQANSVMAAASVNLKIKAMEGQLSTMELRLAPVPPSNVFPVQNQLTPELEQAMDKWLTERIKENAAVPVGDSVSCTNCGCPLADKMADFALESQGASVVSTRCSETYRIRSACVTLFGFPLWYPSESPRTVIQGHPVLLPGKCWAFHGVQGILVISLSHPIRISHVTLDHLPRSNSPTGRIDSAPKDFEVYGMENETEEGTLLGTFTYREDGESTQTFSLLRATDVTYQLVELRVLSNWGHTEYTCLYRFRVHGQLAST